MSTTPFCPHLDQQTERPAERNHCLLFAVLHPVINLAILQDIPCKMSKYFLFLTLCSIYASAGFSVQMESVGGKAILLQNSRQLIQSDSQVKVDGLETFSSMFARIMGGSIEGMDNKASSISGNILYRPAANLLIVVEDEKQNLLSNDDFGNLFAAKKSIAAENPNTWCKLAGAVTRMDSAGSAMALTCSYDGQYALSTSVAREDSKSVTATVSANGKGLIRMPSVSTSGDVEYSYSDVIAHLKEDPHKLWKDLNLNIKGDRFLFHSVDGKTQLTLMQDQKFLVEVGMFSLLVSNFKKSKVSAVEGTHSIVMVMSEAKAFLAEYAGKSQNKLARNIVRTVCKALVEAYSKIFPNRLTAEILVVKKLDHQSNDLLHGARRLVDSTVSVGNATGTGYTAAQVEDYQVYLWSFLLLGFMLYLAVSSLMYMDISEDPQLFATYLIKRPKQD
eukprot:g12738.t1